jgi:hypothetical protein
MEKSHELVSHPEQLKQARDEVIAKFYVRALDVERNP